MAHILLRVAASLTGLAHAPRPTAPPAPLVTLSHTIPGRPGCRCARRGLPRGPDRDAPRFSWVSTGARVADQAVDSRQHPVQPLRNNLGSYNMTYGALAGVVVLMLWLYFTS
jgi:hypothetical protein